MPGRNPPWRIVFLLQDLTFGGTQRQTIALADGISRSVFHPELWTLARGNDLRPAHTPVHELSPARRVTPSALYRLWRRLADPPVDILVLMTAVPNIWGRLIGRLRGVPLIVGNVRGGGPPSRQHERWLWRLADHIVCNSDAFATLLHEAYGVPPSRTSVIRNGVDGDRFRPRKRPGTATLLCPARLVADKDHDTLLDAFELLLQRRPDARLVMVGDGPRRARIASRIRRLPPGSAECLPGQKDLPSLYESCAIVTLSSRHEGLPNVLLEALACARPVVATRVGGVPEIVTDAVDGLLVPPGDPQALAHAWETLLTEPALAANMGAAGAEKVAREFNLRRMIESYEKLLSQPAHRHR